MRKKKKKEKRKENTILRKQEIRKVKSHIKEQQETMKINHVLS